MKRFLNVLLGLSILWIMLIADLSTPQLLAKSTAVFGMLVVARLNHRKIVEFFHEKEPLQWIAVLKFQLWFMRLGGDCTDIVLNPEKYFKKLNDADD